jgi:hypothetical protein
VMRTHLKSSLLVCLALFLPYCGGGSSPADSGSNPTVPIATPTPTPEPTPFEEPPLSASCAALGMGVPDSEASCTTADSLFESEVRMAVDEVRGAHPDWFNGNHVLNIGGYYVEVIRALDRMGLCAAFDGDELGVKMDNNVSEQYDLLTSTELVRTFYIGACRPAVFPQSETPVGPAVEGCSLPPSTLVACGRPESQFYWDVEAALDDLIAERPELFDATDYAPGQGWPAYIDGEAYHDAMVDKLRGKGYCAWFDGEEIQMKTSNEFSEHFDVNYSDKYVRRGPGIYRGACYPAAF